MTYSTRSTNAANGGFPLLISTGFGIYN
jgi:hypothetical protein